MPPKAAKGCNVTLPLSGVEVHRQRVGLALGLRDLHKSYREIRQILNLSGPDEARRLCAKGRRLRGEEGN